MTPPTKFYYVIQMWSCDHVDVVMWSCGPSRCGHQSLVTPALILEKLSEHQFYKDLTRKTTCFEWWSFVFFYLFINLFYVDKT